MAAKVGAAVASMRPTRILPRSRSRSHTATPGVVKPRMDPVAKVEQLVELRRSSERSA